MMTYEPSGATAKSIIHPVMKGLLEGEPHAKIEKMTRQKIASIRNGLHFLAGKAVFMRISLRSFNILAMFSLDRNIFSKSGKSSGIPNERYDY